jgi:hypothetical protein
MGAFLAVEIEDKDQGPGAREHADTGAVHGLWEATCL